jgi:hypothetical protein
VLRVHEGWDGTALAIGLAVWMVGRHRDARPDRKGDCALFYELEMALNERDVARDLKAACEAVAPGMPAEVEAFDSDGSVEIQHDGPPADGLPFEIARHLRGGRDFDPTRPCDWHVRSVTHTNAEARHQRAHVTRIALSQTFRAPPGYHERIGEVR